MFYRLNLASFVLYVATWSFMCQACSITLGMELRAER